MRTIVLKSEKTDTSELLDYFNSLFYDLDLDPEHNSSDWDTFDSIAEDYRDDHEKYLDFIVDNLRGAIGLACLDVFEELDEVESVDYRNLNDYVTISVNCRHNWVNACNLEYSNLPDYITDPDEDDPFRKMYRTTFIEFVNDIEITINIDLQNFDEVKQKLLHAIDEYTSNDTLDLYRNEIYLLGGRTYYPMTFTLYEC